MILEFCLNRDQMSKIISGKSGRAKIPGVELTISVWPLADPLLDWEVLR
jgi:hypothetical protein